MHVTSLKLERFRNYGALHIEPGEGLNIFVGRNAQGKSNLLESLYLLATSKSSRAGKDMELIRFGEAGTRIIADVIREKNSDIEIEMALSPDREEGRADQRRQAHAALGGHRPAQRSAF